MADIIARYTDGRLLIKEEHTCDSNAIYADGYRMRIGHARAVLDVLSIDTNYSRYGLVTNLSEVGVSGAQINVLMRAGETGETRPISGCLLSGVVGAQLMSGIASGLLIVSGWMKPILSGALLSGVVKITARVIGI